MIDFTIFDLITHGLFLLLGMLLGCIAAMMYDERRRHKEHNILNPDKELSFNEHLQINRTKQTIEARIKEFEAELKQIQGQFELNRQYTKHISDATTLPQTKYDNTKRPD